MCNLTTVESFLAFVKKEVSRFYVCGFNKDNSWKEYMRHYLSFSIFRDRLPINEVKHSMLKLGRNNVRSTIYTGSFFNDNKMFCYSVIKSLYLDTIDKQNYIAFRNATVNTTVIAPVKVLQSWSQKHHLLTSHN